MRNIPTSALLVFLLFLPFSVKTQSLDSLQRRQVILAAGTAGLYAGSMLALDQLWYEDFPRSPLHSFDDSKQWLQMDKLGHVTTSYQIGKAGYAAMKWAGAKDQTARWLGGGFGFIYLGGIELLDGSSEEWGFSWTDFASNALGSALFISQEALWKEQRIQLKYSFQKSPYVQYRPELLGSSPSETWLKDYNGQTYWASIKVASFLGEDTFWPKFLCLAIGHGADGIIGASSNPLFDNNNMPYPTFDRQRQWYLSFDLDLSVFASRRRIIKAVLNTFGFIKIPSPTLMYQNKKFTFYPIYF